MLLVLLAQTTPLSGAEGWTGAGLLGLVLAWLLFWHLPGKDKQLEKLIADKDTQIAKVIADKDATIKAVTDTHEAALALALETYRAELKAERVICETRDAALIKTMGENNRALIVSLEQIGISVRQHSVMASRVADQQQEKKS
jgi:hypothetical protein